MTAPATATEGLFSDYRDVTVLTSSVNSSIKFSGSSKSGSVLTTDLRVFQEDFIQGVVVSPFEIFNEGRDSESSANGEVLTDSGWKCRSVLRNGVTADVIAESEVTLTSGNNLWFIPQLGYPETSWLDAKEYLWVIEVYNNETTPRYKKEYHINLIVQKQGAIDSNTSYDYQLEKVLSDDKYSLAINETNSISSIVSPSSVLKIELINSLGKVVQTVGYVSDSVYETSLRAVKLLEPVNCKKDFTTVRIVAKD